MCSRPRTYSRSFRPDFRQHCRPAPRNIQYRKQLRISSRYARSDYHFPSAFMKMNQEGLARWLSGATTFPFSLYLTTHLTPPLSLGHVRRRPSLLAPKSARAKPSPPRCAALLFSPRGFPPVVVLSRVCIPRVRQASD